MPRFSGFNTENKLRIPLSAFAAHTIENDQHSFSIKKTTLINTIIMNFYQRAECTISLRLREYKDELTNCFHGTRLTQSAPTIDTIVSAKAKALSERYSKRQAADVNWQITLNKRVKDFLTQDSNVYEEQFYGDKPGRYVRALIEEYAQLPFHLREEIVFKDILDDIDDAINGPYMLNVTTAKGSQVTMKPVRIEKDPLSMFHYLVGYRPADKLSEKKYHHQAQVLSIRVSRITSVEVRRSQSGYMSADELAQVEKELSEKTVQFVSGTTTPIKVWLSDEGIKKYESQLHLRPVGEPDVSDKHIYTFECTEAQILYYFIGFGKHAKILSPVSLADKFLHIYRGAVEQYEK